MDLGHLKLRCQGVNFLRGALHEDHGLAWTDGQGIFLTQVSLYQGQVENQEHSKLGEFDRGVKSIHWSDNISSGLCYMCVVHDRNISIWRVEGQQPRLSFKQIRKINIQPIAQGCIWNPQRDILCALCPQQSSLYYSHVQNKGSQVLLQLDKDKIQCGCWSADGSKLVICIGTTLMVYHWNDIDVSVTQYTAVTWTVPGLTGFVSSITAISSDRVILAAELPLESLCKNQDTFVVPDLLNSNSNGQITDEITDADVIRPKGKQTSLTESLLNLPRNPNTLIEDSSRLVCIQLREEKCPVRAASVGVKGVLTPDLLLYQSSLNQIVVGSNTQTLIQVFSLHKDLFTKTLEVAVEKDERPIGIASLPEKCCVGDVEGVLVLIGKKEKSDAAFLSSSSVITMKSVLKFFNLKHAKYEKNPLTHTRSAPSIPLSVATNGNHDGKDYDSLYESVMNFGTNHKNSNPDIRKLENKENNNNRIPELVIEVKTESFVESVLKEIPKFNGSHSDGHHSDIGVKVDEVSSPPKRPVRKKKSLRQNRDGSYRHSDTGLLIGKKPEVKATMSMPMEYLSDSSEPSPRYGNHKGSNNSSIESSPDMPIKQLENKVVSLDLKRSTDSEIVSRLAGHNNVDRTGSFGNKVNNGLYEEHQPISQDPEQEMDVRISLQTETQKGGSVSIVEMGKDANSSPRRELEIEKVDFSSQDRNFKVGDFQKLCSEDLDKQAIVENYLSEKLKSKDMSSVKCDSNNVEYRPYENQKSHECASLSSDLGATMKGKPSEKLKSAEGSLDIRERGVGVARKMSTSLESLEDIDKILKEQNEKIARLHEQMNNLSRRVDESSSVLPSRYQSASKPDTVQVCYWCEDGLKTEKKFLLDNGRLQLEQIKQAFSLETVEMLIDDEACVVGSNIDGYIPVRFEPGSTVNINGKPAPT